MGLITVAPFTETTSCEPLDSDGEKMSLGLRILFIGEGLYLLIDAVASLAAFGRQPWYCQLFRLVRGIIAVHLLWLGVRARQ